MEWLFQLPQWILAIATWIGSLIAALKPVVDISKEVKEVVKKEEVKNLPPGETLESIKIKGDLLIRAGWLQAYYYTILVSPVVMLAVVWYRMIDRRDQTRLEGEKRRREQDKEDPRIYRGSTITKLSKSTRS